MYNHPSPTDDYCFADTVLNYGFWEAQQMYYDGWTGRFFHNFIVHANPLVVGWYGGYKVYPIIFLALLMISFYALASQWLYRSFDTGSKLALASGLFIGFMTTLAAIPEYLYWYTGLGSYSISSAFFLLLMAMLLAHQHSGFGLRPGYILAESLLVMAIVGSSEMTMVLAMSLLGMIAFVDLLQRRKISPVVLLLLVVGVVSCYFLIKAPGNAIRLGGNPNSSNIPETLKSSLRYTAQYITHQLIRSPWIPLSLLYLPVAWQLIGSRAMRELPPYLRVHPLLGIVHAFLTILVLISLHFYGVGIPPIPRLINVVNLTFWLSWLYNLTLLVVFLRARLQLVHWPSYARPVALVVFGWAVLMAATGSLLPIVYGDWLSGRAAQYDREMQQRYAQLAMPNTQVTSIAPLTYYPVSLFMEDIHSDPKHLWNRCWADYFHKKTITLKTK